MPDPSHPQRAARLRPLRKCTTVGALALAVTVAIATIVSCGRHDQSRASLNTESVDKLLQALPSKPGFENAFPGWAVDFHGPSSQHDSLLSKQAPPAVTPASCQQDYLAAILSRIQPEPGSETLISVDASLGQGRSSSMVNFRAVRKFGTMFNPSAMRNFAKSCPSVTLTPGGTDTAPPIGEPVSLTIKPVSVTGVDADVGALQLEAPQSPAHIGPRVVIVAVTRDIAIEATGGPGQTDGLVKLIREATGKLNAI